MDTNKIKPAGLIKSLILFCAFGAILYFLLNELPPTCALGATSLILFITSLIAYKLEGRKLTIDGLTQRFRLKWFKNIDWVLMIRYSVIIIVLMVVIYAYENKKLDDFELRGLMSISDPWIFAKIIPLIIFNIFGEEYFWRGYLLPKQQLVFKNYAWIVNSALWLMYYLVIGWQLVLILLPLILIPYIAQRRNNTCDGVVVHGMVSGVLLLVLVFINVLA